MKTNHYIKCAVWCRKECEFRVAGKVDADKADVTVKGISAIKRNLEKSTETIRKVPHR